jgi:serine/threonine-protein kinase
MSDSSATRLGRSALTQHLDRLCDRFEAAWAAGQRPKLEDFLAEAAEADQTALLRELLLVELYYRRRAGEQPTPQDYTARFPAFDLGWLADAGAPVAPATLPAVPGYEIIGRLGRGGMGVVYKARQVKLDRLVALKMILRGPHATPQDLSRFRHEAEAVARIHHPQVVQIYEVGEHGGLPYLTLELVEGSSLDRELAGAPQLARAAAQLLETVARAAHHAHERGIVHRDLKPANILLHRKSDIPKPNFEEKDGGNVSDFAFRISDFDPKIADFGLAKRLDLEAGPTQTGEILGTPCYMAPEQTYGKTLAHQVGPATDVYALGAILYEMLTGRPPFRGADPVDTLLQVQQSEPVPPRQLQPRVPRDLEIICLKCLHKETSRRYGSAGALADDLQRFLAGRPIHARPLGAVQRLGRWCKRKPALASLSAALILVVLGALAGLTWLWLDAEEQRRRAQAGEKEAQSNFNLAKEAVDGLYLLASDDPLFRSDAMLHARRLLLEKALPFYEGFRSRRPGEAQTDVGGASNLCRLANILDVLGRKPEALAKFEQARDIWEKLAAAHPETPQYQCGLARTYNNFAHLHRSSGKPGPARQWCERSLAIWKKLTEAHPEVAEYQADQARTYVLLGHLQGGAGQQAAARKSYEQALAIQRKLANAHPGVADYQSDLAEIINVWGVGQMETGEWAAARKSYEQALAIREQLAAAHSEITLYQKSLGDTYNNLGNLLLKTRDWAAARRRLEQARAVDEQLVAAHRAVMEYQIDLAATHVNLGLLCAATGRFQDSLPHFAKAISLLDAVRKKEPQNDTARIFLRNAHWARADTLAQAKHYSQAVPDCDRALTLDRGEQSQRTPIRVLRAVCLARAGNHSRAAAEANELAADKALAADAAYDLACVYSLASSAARKDSMLVRLDRDIVVKQYETRAVELLHKARAKGHFQIKESIDHMKKDSDLDPVRSREDFKKLLGELQEGKVTVEPTKTGK